MPHATEHIKNHHRSISECLAGGVDAIVATDLADYDAKKDKFNEFVEFLTDDLTPHAEGEERSMYPAVRDLICKYDNPLATMSLDHQAIMDRINRLKDAVAKMNERPDQRQTLLQEVKKLAIELGALISVHLAKEEIALIPLMEQHMSDDEVEAVVHGMHGE